MEVEQERSLASMLDVGGATGATGATGPFFHLLLQPGPEFGPGFATWPIGCVTAPSRVRYMLAQPPRPVRARGLYLYICPKVSYNQGDQIAFVQEGEIMPLYRCPVTKQKGYYQLNDAWDDFYQWAEAYFGPYHAFDELDMLPLPCYAIWELAGEPHSHWDFMAWLKTRYPKFAEDVESMEKVPKTDASVAATLVTQDILKPKAKKIGTKAFTKNGKKKKKPPKPCDRSAAAKKAWETRRKNREKRKRSDAAKKAWETRRAKAGIEIEACEYE